MSDHSNESRYQTALNLVKSGEFADARDMLDTLLKTEPDHSPARFALAGLLVQQGELQAGTEAYLAVLEREPEHTDSHQALAGILYQQQRYAASEAAYRHTLGLDPDRSDAVQGLSRSLWQLGKTEESLATLRQWLDNHPDDLNCWHLIAQLAARQQRWNECLIASDVLLEAGIDHGAIAQQRAQALAGLKRWSDAESAFQDLCGKNRDDSNAWIGLAASQAAQGKRDQAHKASKSALQNKPLPVVGPEDTVVLRSLGPSIYQFNADGQIILERENNIDSHLDGLKVHDIYLQQCDSDARLAETIKSAGLIINAVSDPDRDPDALTRVSSVLNEMKSIVINKPDAIAACTRDRNWRRFADHAGLLFPKTMTTDANNLDKHLREHGFDMPYILRRVGTHMGASVARIDNEEQRVSFLAANPDSALYLIEYVDNPFRPGIYRRMRLMFIDGEPIAIGCHFNRDWNVHSADRSSVMHDDPSLGEAEKAFVENPQATLGDVAYEAVAELPEIVGLEYFGVDFDILPDGRALIFEINAAMAPNARVLNDFPYLTTAFERLGSAVRTMAASRLAKA